MSFVLRESKGLPLTHQEMDNNLKLIRDYISICGFCSFFEAAQYALGEAVSLDLTFNPNDDGELFATHQILPEDENKLFYVDCEPHTYISLINSIGYNCLFLTYSDGVFVSDFEGITKTFYFSGQPVVLNCMYPVSGFDYSLINVPYRVYFKVYSGQVSFYKNV